MSRYSCSIRNLVISLLLPIASINAAMIPVSPSGSPTEIFSLPQTTPKLEVRRVHASPDTEWDFNLGQNVQKALAQMGSTGGSEVKVELPPYVNVLSTGEPTTLPFIPVQLDSTDPTKETMVPLEGRMIVIRPEGHEGWEVKSAPESHYVEPTCALDSREDDDAVWYSEGEDEDVVLKAEASPILAPRDAGEWAILKDPAANVIEAPVLAPIPAVTFVPELVKEEVKEIISYPQSSAKKDSSSSRYILGSGPFTQPDDGAPERLWVSCVDHGRILYRTFKITWGPAEGDTDNCDRLKKNINKRGLVTRFSCVQEYNAEKQIYQMAAMGHRPQGVYGLLASAIRETFEGKALAYANMDTKMLCQR